MGKAAGAVVLFQRELAKLKPAVPLVAFSTQRLHVDVLMPATGPGMPADTLPSEIHDILVPDVLKHLPEPLQLPDEANPIDGWLAARQAESCLYAVREAHTGALLGLMILADTSACDAAPTLRLGYLFGQFAWGKGYATELVSGLIARLSAKHWRGQILAGVTSANPASSRVLLKTGFDEVQGGAGAASRAFRARL